MRFSHHTIIPAGALATVAGAALAVSFQPTTEGPAQPGAAAVAPAQAGAETPAEQPTILSAEQLDELLGPIALYPDPLISQILPASTYPLEVVQAARWVRAHPDLKGVDDQDWDSSVRAVAHYPSVIQMMDQKLDWTMRLGQAFVNQQQDVMNSIQQLRAKARAAGTLRDTPQQSVVLDQEAIRIVPAQPDIIYVPSYNPALVYVPPPPGWYYDSYFAFGSGFVLGWWLDLDCDWHHHHVYYHEWRPHYPWHPHEWDHHGPGEHWHPGREGERWHHDPHRDGPPGIHRGPGPHGPPTPGSRGWPSGERHTGPRGETPRQPHPAPGGPMPGGRPAPSGGTPRSTPGATPGVRPAPGPHPSGGAGRPKPTPGAFGGYQRGTQTQQNSTRGQSSRGYSSPYIRPAPAAPRSTPHVTPAPRPAPRTVPSVPAAPRGGASPRGAFGGYRPGPAATSASQRGQSSRGGHRG